MAERPVYSGPKSVAFWERVNAVSRDKDDFKLYGLGCDLQSLELEVLRQLSAAAKAAQKEKARQYARERYQKYRDNPEFLRKRRLRDKLRAKTPARKESQKRRRAKYAKTEKGKAAQKRSGKKYRKTPVGRARHNLRQRLRELVHDHGQHSNITGCDRPTFRAHLSAQFAPGMSWDNYGEWHIDHIMPCATFDLSDPEQVKECFHYSNLQPLWAADNIAKGSTAPARDSRTGIVGTSDNKQGGHPLEGCTG